MIELVTISGERIYTISTEGSINPLPRSSTPKVPAAHTAPYQYSNPKDIAITLRINRKLRSDATLG